MECIASDLAFPVGLVAASSGELFVSEGGAGRVTALDPDGRRRALAAVAGGPMGLAQRTSGALVVADNGGKHPPAPSTGDEAGADAAPPAVHEVGLDGRVVTLVTEIGGTGLLAPNGVCLDDGGGVWFADSLWDFADDIPGRGCLGYVAADGAVTRVAADLRFPASVALDERGETLYVSEAMDSGVWAFDVVGPGALGPPRVFVRLDRDATASGLAFDAAGHLIVSGHTSGCLYAFDRSGALVDTVVAGPATGLGQLAFGGPDGTTLYVTAAATGEVYATPWRWPGLPLRG